MNRMLSVCAIAFAAAVLLPAQEQQPAPDVAAGAPTQATIEVTGIDGQGVNLSLADLSKLPQHTVNVTEHGKPASFGSVLLTDVLAKVALPVGEKFHRTAASCYLLVEARDGYKVVFAWAELDATFMDKPIFLATTRDGKPLSGTDGPFQLVAPGEKRAARWIRQVTAMRIRQAN